MKLTLFCSLLIALGLSRSYADEGPTFVKVGGTYALTATAGVTLPRLITISASGGGGWFRVTTPGETGPNAHPVAGLGDRWINFNQLVEIRETVPMKGPK